MLEYFTEYLINEFKDKLNMQIVSKFLELREEYRREMASQLDYEEWYEEDFRRIGNCRNFKRYV